MKLLVKKLHEEAILPTKSRDTDEGYDIYALEPKRIFKGSTVKVPTGIAAAVEDLIVYRELSGITYEETHQFWIQIEGRSGMATKGVFPVGGIVDHGYTGEIGVMLTNNGDQDHFVKQGDKIAQLIIRKHHHTEIEEVNEFPETDRGDKGFGSSGR